MLALAQRVDSMLLVIEESVTTVEDMGESARLLNGHNLIGTVLNKSSEKPRKFESYYQTHTV